MQFLKKWKFLLANLSDFCGDAILLPHGYKERGSSCPSLPEARADDSVCRTHGRTVVWSGLPTR